MPQSTDVAAQSANVSAPWWLGVLPWIMFAVGQWCYPPIAAPLAAAVFALAAFRFKIRWNALDAGILAYFVILSILNFAGGADFLSARMIFALCPAVLAVAAVLSVAFRNPFTLAYARQYAPAHVQSRPAFFQANQLITMTWAAGFATAAALIALGSGEGLLAQPAVILVAMLGATAVVSVVIGGWFHFRESKITT